MISIRKIETILQVCFCGGLFLTQIIGWTIVSYMGDYESSIWCIWGTALLNTFITCTGYWIFYKLHRRINKSEEEIWEVDFYEMFGAD